MRKLKRGRTGGTRDILESGDFSDADLTHGPYYFCAEGYEETIDLLIAKWEGSGRDYYWSDAFVFPLGFICRHLVELRMKAALEVLTGSAPDDTHSLMDLWSQLRPAIEDRWPSSNEPTRERYGHLSKEKLKELQGYGVRLSRLGQLDDLERLVKALHEADPEGVSFRYPGEMQESVKRISLDRLAQSAKAIASYCDGVVTGVTEEESFRAEMAAEYAAEVADAAQQ